MIRTLVAISLLPLAGMSQMMPAALQQGVLLERDAPAASGQFCVRAPDNLVFRYLFDSKTYVEREKQTIDVARLLPGEKVEVLSEAVPGSLLRLARTIHVVGDPPPSPRMISSNRLHAPSRPTPDYFLSTPLGNLTYSGVVFRLSAERLMLHTRAGDQAILLRKDTRFVENGEQVESTQLPLNHRVFVRAGKDLYDQVEALQIVWGRILDPH